MILLGCGVLREVSEQGMITNGDRLSIIGGSDSTEYNNNPFSENKNITFNEKQSIHTKVTK
jgi:hypothetical protein